MEAERINRHGLQSFYSLALFSVDIYIRANVLLQEVIIISFCIATGAKLCFASVNEVPMARAAASLVLGVNRLGL